MFKVALTIAACCFFGASAPAATLDDQLDVIRGEAHKGPSADMKIIGHAIDTINHLKTASAGDQEVESLNPMWLSTQLREKGVTKAALSLCGGDLHSCDDAKQRLKILTAQCTQVFLGTIDIDKFPGTPKNLYDTTDPELILLHPPEDESIKGLVRIGVMATISPNTVAIVMCPEESKAFGAAMRMRIPN